MIGRFLNAFARRCRLCPGLWVLWLALLGGGPVALAQTTNTVVTNTMGLGVTVTPSPATLLEALTYTLSVTNFYPTPLTGATVTNTMPDGVLLLTATNDLGNNVVTNGNNVVFFLTPLTNLQVVTCTVVVQPTALGSLTNIATVGQTRIFFGSNPPPVTNITTTFAGHVDLQATLTGPTGGILVNDRLQYQVAVTNLGPDDASGVVVSNTLPAGTILLGISPATTVATVDGQSVVVRFDTLVAGTGQQFALDLQPTNSGLLSLTAVVGADGFIDDNSADNSKTLLLFVSAPVAGQVTATIVSPQQFNPQTGLMEQMVRLTNGGTNDVPNVRLVISGLTNQLVNAGGTNGSDPFVVLGTALGAGQSVDLLLELFVPQRVPVADPTLQPFTVLASVPPLPNGSGPVTNRFTLLPSGRVLVEFSSVPGHRYAVIYGDSATNTIVSLPAIVAPADVTQWFDYGPPRTAIPPSNAPVRLYRVVELP